MANIRLREYARGRVVAHMLKVYDTKHEGGLDETLYAKVMLATNGVLRSKWPEVDMAVLRKYNATTHDGCIRFVTPSGRVFGVQAEDENHLVDIPVGSGCRNRDVLPSTEDFGRLVDDWQKARSDAIDARNKAASEYHAFLSACRYVEDVEAVVSLPPDLRAKIGATSNLVAVNDDVVARLREQFLEPVDV